VRVDKERARAHKTEWRGNGREGRVSEKTLMLGKIEVRRRRG